MDLLDELEAMVQAIYIDDDDALDTLVVEKWQHLFSFSTHEAIQNIKQHRLSPQALISDAHWDMVREEKEAEGFDREAYEYSCTRIRKQPIRDTMVTEGQKRRLQQSTFLLKLEGPLSTAEAVAEAANLGTSPTVIHATDADGQPSSFCEVNGLVKNAIEKFLGDFRPTFIRYSKARKSLSDTSRYPTLGIDTTMPQHRLQTAQPRPKQNEYPVWYFVYGTLAESHVVARLLGRRPTYYTAWIYGGRLKDWGLYKALVDDSDGNAVVSGKAFQITAKSEEECLQVYETDNYEVVRVGISIQGKAGLTVDGLTFKFVERS
ncbi:hypothetical protein CDV36_014559 [Fusarium kuroshium]|uniref:Putative gamma-glutamylcyclotransferase n=1 Tax=Fusarium kuroshium TaxID=2010991 RepID=A0A3M2RHZ8_9HYPO|nr:hypothetical protein CDV36_014559 [Fusarium kuroshium]